MPLCLAAGALAAVIATESFTLSWTHSVEKIPWEEDWRIAAGGLELVEARVRGAGAGMEAPAEARYEAGLWRYRPELAPQAALTLAESGAVPAWRLCVAGDCRTLADWLQGEPPDGTVRLTPCDPPGGGKLARPPGPP